MSQAIAAYNWGPGNVSKLLAGGGDLSGAPKQSRDEIARITQTTPDFKQQADTTREWDRSLDSANRTYSDLQANLGKSNAALTAAQEAQKEENQVIASGLPPSDQMKASIAGRAAAYADLAQRTAALKVDADTQFGIDQLGRTPDQASVAAKLRSSGIDPETAQGKATADQIERLQALTQVKDTGSSFVKGMTADLIAGQTAGKAVESQLQRILSKLADSAVGSLFSGLFGSLLGGGKSGSAGGGLFSSIGSLLHLATGGRVIGSGTGTSDSVPAMLSHGEFVVNAAAAGKNAGLLSLLNSGHVARFAAGGMVGSMPSIPNAVAASSAGALSVTHAPVINMTPAQGVTAQQVAKAIADNQRMADRNILSTYSNAKRRYR